MGAWGAGTFENDHASDWFSDLLEGEPSMVRSALERIANAPADEYLDADDCCEALAASELVAAAAGKGLDRLPEDEGQEWLETHRAELAKLTSLARGAVERVERKSELQELWDEGGRNDEWHADIAELRRRL